MKTTQIENKMIKGNTLENFRQTFILDSPRDDDHEECKISLEMK